MQKEEQFRANWYAAAVVLAYECACGVDIAQVSVLVKPIERTYGIGDTEFAAIAVSSLYLGRTVLYYAGGVLADTYNRRNVLLASGILWTLAALSVTFAAHSWQLFASRLLSGIALSLGGASIFHILVDSFSRSRRSIAISLFGVGVQVGLGLGLALCGGIVAVADRIGPLVVPGIGRVLPWQLCFVFVAALGVAVCCLLFTIREPTRLEVRHAHDKPNVLESLRTFFWYSRRHGLLWAIFLPANYAFVGGVIVAIQTWQPTFAARVYHVPVGTAAAILGTLIAVTLSAGRLVGGAVAQTLVNRGNADLLPRTFAYFPAAALVFTIAYPLAPSYPLSLGLMTVALLSAGIVAAFQVNAIQDTVPNEVRGQILGFFSIVDFISSLIGSALVAYISDRFFGGGAGLRYSLAIVGATCSAGAAIAFLFCVRPYQAARRDLDPDATARFGGRAEQAALTLP
jgi:MFS family permease